MVSANSMAMTECRATSISNRKRNFLGSWKTLKRFYWHSRSRVKIQQTCNDARIHPCILYESSLQAHNTMYDITAQIILFSVLLAGLWVDKSRAVAKLLDGLMVLHLETMSKWSTVRSNMK